MLLKIESVRIVSHSPQNWFRVSGQGLPGRAFQPFHAVAHGENGTMCRARGWLGLRPAPRPEERSQQLPAGAAGPGAIVRARVVPPLVGGVTAFRCMLFVRGEERPQRGRRNTTPRPQHTYQAPPSKQDRTNTVKQVVRKMLFSTVDRYVGMLK